MQHNTLLTITLGLLLGTLTSCRSVSHQGFDVGAGVRHYSSDVLEDMGPVPVVTVEYAARADEDAPGLVGVISLTAATGSGDDATVGNLGEADVQATMVDLTAGLRYELLDGPVRPYLAGGLGAAYLDGEGEANGVTADVDETLFQAYLGAGLDVELAEGLDVFLDLRYAWTSDFDAFQGVQTDADHAQAALGLRWGF